MNPTNERVTIELEHAPTGKMYAWKFRDHAVPARAYLDDRINELRKKHENIIKDNDLPTGEDGLPNYDEIDEKFVIQLSDINHKILKTQMDALCCVLQPAEDLPEGYSNKRELLEECITSYEVPPMIMNFFSEHLGSSTPSRGAGSLPIRFRKPNGETFDPYPEWTKARTNGSAGKTSSTG